MIGGSRLRWLAFSAAACVLLPWFFSCPLFAPNAEGRELRSRYWAGVVQRKIDHPLYDYTREFRPESNEAKRNFRLLVPLLARLGGGSFTAVHVVRFSLHAVLIIGLLLAAERACRDRVAAIGVALAMAGTHLGTAVWRDSFYTFDNCAHAFVVLALLSTHAWLAGGAAFLGLLVDERVLCALTLVALFHQVTGARRAVQVGLMLSVPSYLALRVGLSTAYGLGNPLAGVGGADVLIPNLANAPAAFWFALEGGWLLLFAAARAAGPRTHEMGVLLGFTLVVLMASAFVGDFSRSTIYAFPATLVALAMLARRAAADFPLRRLAAYAAGVSLLVPNASVIWDNVGFESSLPVRAVQAWLRTL